MTCSDDKPLVSDASFARTELPALRKYVIDGDNESVKKWVGAYPDRVDATDENGWTALHFAAANDNNGNIIDTLIKAKLSINKVTHNHWSPLHLAAFNNNSVAVDQLLRSGADAALVDDGGFTAGQMAELCGQHVMAGHLHHFFLQKKREESASEVVQAASRREKEADAAYRRKIELRKRRKEDRDRIREQERIRRLRNTTLNSEMVSRESVQREFHLKTCQLLYSHLTDFFSIEKAPIDLYEIMAGNSPLRNSLTPQPSNRKSPSRNKGQKPKRRKRREDNNRDNTKRKPLRSVSIPIEEVTEVKEDLFEPALEASRKTSTEHELQRRLKREQWVEHSDITHTGEYIKSADGEYKWSCCRTTVEYGEGCTIALDRTKPMLHFGEFRFHVSECTCGTVIQPGNSRRRSKVSFSHTEALTPRKLHAIRLHGKGSFCTPDSGCYDCCGRTDRDSPGCYPQKVYLSSESPVELLQPTAMEGPGVVVGSLRISSDQSSFKCTPSSVPEVYTVVCNPSIRQTSSCPITSFQFEVTVEEASYSQREFLNIGVVDEAWLSLPESCKVRGTRGVYSSFLGGYHSLGWWSNSTVVGGMGYREHTQPDPTSGSLVRYGVGDSVTVLVDLLNKEIVFFANRVLASIIRLPAVLNNSAVFPAISLHSGSKLSFRPSVKTATLPLRPVAREKERWFKEWQQTRYTNEKQEREEMLTDMKKSEQDID